MSYPPQQPPVTPGYDSPPPQGDWTPPKKTGRAIPWLIGVLGVLLIVVFGLVVALANGSGKPTAGASQASPPLPQDPCGGGICATTPISAAAPPDSYQPKVSDFKLTPKITDKQCFGSAGCNVDLEVKVAYGGPPLSADDTWRITYQITGDESGPIIGSTDITGENYDLNEESLSTKNSKTKITIKVTDVEKRGL